MDQQYLIDQILLSASTENTNYQTANPAPLSDSMQPALLSQDYLSLDDSMLAFSQNLPGASISEWNSSLNSSTHIPWDEYKVDNASSQGHHESQPAIFQCDWPGCKNPGPFKTKGSLARHRKYQHVERQSFRCPHAGCPNLKLFNRKDNLNDHQRRIHGYVIPPQMFQCPYVECSEKFNCLDDLEIHRALVHAR